MDPFDQNQTTAEWAITQAKQRTRLTNMRYGFYAYLVALFIWFLAYQMGFLYLPVRVALAMVILHCAAQGLFVSLILANWNLKFKEPSLTIPVIVTALVINGPVLMYMTRESRAIMLFLFLFPFFFTLLRLTYRQCYLIATFGIISYLGLLFLIHRRNPEQLDIRLEMLNLTVFGVSLMWLAFFAGHVSTIRKHLRRKNLENRQLLARLEEMAERDELTGLVNRRKFMERVTELRQWADRKGKTLCLAMIDLDHFKRVNDQYGHAMGDRVLQTFGSLALSELRGYDLIARYGGEEFVVIQSDTELKASKASLERLQRAFSKIHFEGGGRGVLKATFSVGIATYLPGEDMEDTLERADKALYQAKAEGRNRVCMESRLVGKADPAAN
ncbi:GGDEF domain-containing protein [Sulfidibacter corallicola]|uniref:diguanylate cyclase n=1 Tax=Sulfidibacter corallicola TaxID=2818388 RepID=A0A8A4TQF3_SULCO|nr:GGDEF domain-containing protein [Sulfidibacter corallicola]QTD51161.1 GGDEF domain-containing protein [Sulfidibacter corallicola]